MNINSFTKYFPANLTETIFLTGTDDLEEIRLYNDNNCFLVKGGKIINTNYFISDEVLEEIVKGMCRGSLFAMQETLKEGYITLPGGHRAGVTGIVIQENGKITHMQKIQSVCIRISREIIGASDKIYPYLDCDGKIYNTLLISPPGGGKTTVLRDIARRLGEKYKVCIVDERSEIASLSSEKKNVGPLTSVLDKAPKAQGIRMLLRTMSPDIIITDETGSTDEERAIYEIINCGAKIITTVHGYSEKDILHRKYMRELVEEKIFERIIVLSKNPHPGSIKKIIADGRVMNVI